MRDWIVTSQIYVRLRYVDPIRRDDGKEASASVCTRLYAMTVSSVIASMLLVKSCLTGLQETGWIRAVLRDFFLLPACIGLNAVTMGSNLQRIEMCIQY